MTEVTHDDFMAMITHRRDIMIRAMLDYNDAVEGLQVLAGLTPPDEPGVAELGEEGEVVARFVKAALDFKRINATEGSA